MSEERTFGSGVAQSCFLTLRLVSFPHVALRQLALSDGFPLATSPAPRSVFSSSQNRRVKKQLCATPLRCAVRKGSASPAAGASAFYFFVFPAAQPSATPDGRAGHPKRTRKARRRPESHRLPHSRAAESQIVKLFQGHYISKDLLGEEHLWPHHQQRLKSELAICRTGFSWPTVWSWCSRVRRGVPYFTLHPLRIAADARLDTNSDFTDTGSAFRIR